MALYIKGIFMLAFLIGWVSAIDYDIDKKFNEIFTDLKTHFEHLWKWVQSTTNQGLKGINRIFVIHKPLEQKRYKYQDVINQENSSTSAQSAGKEELSTSTSTSPSTELNPEIKSNSDSTYSESNSKEPLPVPLAHAVDHSNNVSQEEHKPSVETVETEECDTFPPPESESKTERPADDTDESIKSEYQSEAENPVQEIDESKPDTPIEGIYDESANTETESPTVQQPIIETESPKIAGMPAAPKIMEDFQPIIVDEQPTEKVKAIGDIEQYENHNIKKATSQSIVYEQQNIIIMFLFFLMMVMGIYFFLLTKTQAYCPTIVIGELNGNLKPTIKK